MCEFASSESTYTGGHFKKYAWLHIWWPAAWQYIAIVNSVCTLNPHSLSFKFHFHSLALIITAAAGAVDEASFFASFEDVPKVTIYSTRELEDTLTKVREIIASSSTDWDKRVDAVSRLAASQVFGV